MEIGFELYFTNFLVHRTLVPRAGDHCDRTDRSLMLAWPSAIRPIVAVERLLFRPFRLRSRSAYQGRSSRPRPIGRLRFAWFLARIIA